MIYTTWKRLPKVYQTGQLSKSILEFWYSRNIHVYLCERKFGFFWGVPSRSQGFSAGPRQPSLLFFTEFCDSCAIETLAVETVLRANLFGSECTGWTALDGFPFPWCIWPGIGIFLTLSSSDLADFFWKDRFWEDKMVDVSCQQYLEMEFVFRYPSWQRNSPTSIKN